LEIEVEGARNGGEWFGGSKVWETPGAEGKKGKSDAQQTGSSFRNNVETPDEGKDGQEVAWWVKNFWTAYDALSE